VKTVKEDEQYLRNNGAEGVSCLSVYPLKRLQLPLAMFFSQSREQDGPLRERRYDLGCGIYYFTILSFRDKILLDNIQLLLEKYYSFVYINSSAAIPPYPHMSSWHCAHLSKGNFTCFILLPASLSSTLRNERCAATILTELERKIRAHLCWSKSYEVFTVTVVICVVSGHQRFIGICCLFLCG
jgi:hypothetical protein